MNFFRLTLIIISFSICNIDFAQTDSLIIASPVDSSALNQDTSSVFIAGISLYGNKKTKDFIITREIPFKLGDNIASKDLNKLLILAKNQLINTSLFLSADVYVEHRYGQYVFITVYVKERWYIFPLPYFSIVDRNFNTWWVTYNHSLKRVNYGIKFLNNNFTGRNDKLTVWLITGYSRQVSLKYERPYFDKNLKNGYNIYFNYTQQRELNYETNLSKQTFFKPDSSYFLRRSVSGEADYVYRPELHTRHIFRLGFVNETVADTILKLNPNYFPNQKTHITYPLFGYTLQYFNADYNAYPTKGILGQLMLTHSGINKNYNITQLQITSSYTIPILPKTQIQFQEGGIISLPFKQPFFSTRMFNYGTGSIFMRGLEYYVIDGVAGIVGRATLKRQIAQFNFRLAAGTKQQLDLPFRFFAKIYTDEGYAYNKNPGNSLLNNKLLRTWGFGVDMITAYDVVFKFDYSFNQLGQSGFFFHVRTDF